MFCGFATIVHSFCYKFSGEVDFATLAHFFLQSLRRVSDEVSSGETPVFTFF